MAGSVNKVILIGALGKDPECRTIGNGNKVANLSVATSERWKDKAAGERKERTEWHRVTIWGQLADVADRYCKKGTKVYLCGSLQTRKWTDQNGQEKYSTEVVLQGFNAELTILDGGKRRDNGMDGAGGGMDSDGGWEGATRSGSTAARTSPKPADDDGWDDDVPF